MSRWVRYPEVAGRLLSSRPLLEADSCPQVKTVDRFRPAVAKRALARIDTVEAPARLRPGHGAVGRQTHRHARRNIHGTDAFDPFREFDWLSTQLMGVADRGRC